METKSETIKMYLLCTALTIAVFGLGYFCGQNTEKHFSIDEKTLDAAPISSKASTRQEQLLYQRSPRKAGRLV